MDVEKSETEESDVKTKDPDERTLRSSAERVRLSLCASHSQPGSSKSDVSSNPVTTETTQHGDTEPQLVQRTSQSLDSDAHAVYNFDQFTVSSVVTKRGRGRPRKDGRSPVQAHHRKIFPGRPRARARKVYRQLFASELIKSNTVKSDAAAAFDTKDPLSSGCEKRVQHPGLVGSASSEKCFVGGYETSFGQVDAKVKRFCSLCNLGDNSCLGQGRLKLFRPTPGFSPQESFVAEIDHVSEASDADHEQAKPLLRNTKQDRDSSKSGHQKLCLENSEPVINQDVSLELSAIGFDAPLPLSDLFLASGETYVHHSCAIWSEGVEMPEFANTDKAAICEYSDTEGTAVGTYLNVDKAVVNGINQKCARCKKYGATVKCDISGCQCLYHFPCAVMCGSLQNMTTMRKACSSHEGAAQELGINCKVCNAVGDAATLLFCTICFKHYHASCLEPPININTVVRAGWQCIECKRCQTCRQAGDESRMLVCETCDKGYHTFCLRPSVATVPKSGWKCHSCRLCGDCGARTPGSGPSSRWHLNYTVCDSCYQQRNKGIACPLCGKAYRQFLQKKGMRHCCVCRKYIHAECDPRPEQTVNPLEYVCPVCVNPVELDENAGHNSADLPKGKSHDSSTSPPEVFLSSSRDSFTTENDNSPSSTESDSATETTTGNKASAKGSAKTAESQRRKKSTKMKIKPFTSSGQFSFPSALNEPKGYKTDDDDQSSDNKMVLVSANDEFALCQDLCVMCGSFGKGEEGRLIACAQCGQCYHSYCASIKVTSVVLRKGWRCLDCTVCEGCGKPHDESRLLLCDECDISFHTYCLDPPLTEVPPGNWKCKWCVMCVRCGSRSPGVKCGWQMNYTLCGPCASITTCPACSENYKENELIIECNVCKRWLHGACDQIVDEESAEICSELGYSCVLCRPSDDPPPHLLPPPLPPSPEPEPVIEKPVSPVLKTKEQDITVKTKPAIQFYLDGVCLSESGLQHIKSLTPEMPKKVPRPRKPRQSVFGPVFPCGSIVPMKFPTGQNFAGVDGYDVQCQTQGLDPSNLESSIDTKTEQEQKVGSSEDTRHTGVDYQKDLLAEDSEKKKRPRKMQKLGIGGFVVKPRGRSSLVKEANDEVVLVVEPSYEASHTPVGDIAHTHAVGSESSETHAQEKPKRRRKPKKRTPLDESFPSYLRDAFFGKDLLLSCKKADSSWELMPQEEASTDSSNQNVNRVASKDNSSNGQQGSCFSSSECSDKVNSFGMTIGSASSKEFGNSHQDMKTEISLSTSGQGFLNASSQGDDSANLDGAGGSLNIKSENTSFDSGNCKDIPSLGDPSGFPKIDSKDVEDVIEGVLKDQIGCEGAQSKTKVVSSNRLSAFLSETSSSPVSLSQTQQSSPFSMQRSAGQMHTQSSPVHRENTPSLQHQDSNSSWSESEGSDQAPMPKSTMKWEADETLGLQSTISPVLYANMNCPHLKLEYPNWGDRVKQIAKIWRSLPSEKRQPYLQKARENRAASRTQKASADLDRSKESKVQEMDQEKQWKQFQALRQLQQQKNQKLQEQRPQVSVKTLGDKLDKPHSFHDIDSPLKSNQSRSLADISQIPSSGPIHDTESNVKDVGYESPYGKKWVSESSLAKPDDLSSQHGMQQPQVIQGRIDVPMAPRHSPQGRSHQASPFIQVTRVRPPVDPSHVASVDPVVHQESSISSAEQYSRAQSALSPRGMLPSHNRMAFPPVSPVSRHSLLIPRPEISCVMAPMQKELVYAPSSASRSQNSDSLYQNSGTQQSQYLSAPESSSAGVSHSSSSSSGFQTNAADVGMFGMSANSGQFPSELTGSAKDVSKSFYSPQSSAGGNLPGSQSHMLVPQTAVVDTSKKLQTQHAMQTEQFLHQQSAQTSPVHQNLHKDVVQFKDDIYRTMPGTPRPQQISNQDCIMPQQQSVEHILKESPDPNKLMAHQQLKELLQKQQVNKQEDAIFGLRNKDPSTYSQWTKGLPSPAFQYVTKDDCFRHPLPPTQRTRNPLVKDGKSDLASDLLGTSSLKLDLLHGDENAVDPKSVHHEGNLTSGNLPSVQHHDVTHHVIDMNQKTMETESVSATDTKVGIEKSVVSESRSEKLDAEISISEISEDSKRPADLVSSEQKDVVSSPGPGKKRKTTAGDLVKDLESQPEEQDAIASACNLDVLTGDVGELELDDDELLGLGNDFNILEYADPELDKGLVGEGEKSNILDEHLDLDDKDELEDEDEEMKSQPSAEEKDMNPDEVPADDKSLLDMEVSSIQKPSDTNLEPANIQTDYLKFEKKENVEYKSSEMDLPEKKASELVDPVKEEVKSSFPSCSLSSDDLNLKDKVETVKELHIPGQPVSSFSSGISSIDSEESTQAFPTQVESSNYRVTNVVRQNLSPSAHFQQPGLVSQQQSSFPLNVGVPVRPSASAMQAGILASPTQPNRPLLLQEQPLLLEDLVEQEKREQMRQTQEGLISPHGDALLSDIDFERLKDDVFSGPPDDSLGGPGALLGSHEPLKPVIPPSASTNNTPSHNFGPPPYSLVYQNQDHSVSCAGPARGQGVMQPVQPRRTQVPNVMGSVGLPHGLLLHGEPPVRPVQPHRVSPVAGGGPIPFVSGFLAAPPSPPVMDPHTEQEKQKILQYEKFLIQQQTVLSSQQKYFETEVIKLRKMKKALNAKQRQLRKNGSELTESDAIELARISQEQAGLQKQLDQIRKQSRQHSIALQDYRLKQQKRQQQQQASQSQSHAPLSSLQQPPQNPHAAHQMGQAAPPSPMLPSSPVVPSPSRIQHSPSPMMQHSPAVMTTSAVIQQSSQLIHSHMLPQQVHFQVPQAEGKGWCNAVQVPPTVMSERPGHKDSIDNQCGPTSMPSVGEKFTHRVSTECKPCLEPESCLKRLSEGTETAVLSIPDEQNVSKPAKPETIQTSDIRSDSTQETDEPVEKSILSQSLPSSVTNTLNFTLRQTGMPTVCLPSATSEESVQSEVSAANKSEALGIDGPKIGSDAASSHESNENLSDHPRCEAPDSVCSLAKPCTKDIKTEITCADSQGGSHVLLSEVKREVTSYDGGDEHQNSESSSYEVKNNEASSDEELEDLAKRSCSAETEQDQGKQNVLLKQLLQNCPSAETSRKQEMLIDVKKEDVKLGETCFDGNDKDTAYKKGDDQKSKKPSYLDIRRAQLEKEPTPPPIMPSHCDTRAKPSKRKRPKKKKLDGKDGSPLKKKCQRNPIPKSEEGGGTPLENLMSQLTNLPPLRILEPNIKPNFNILPVSGAGDLNAKENQLKGTYGNAVLPNQSDIYSYYPYDKEHAPPVLSLPPSPPYRGFYGQEFPSVPKEKPETSPGAKSCSVVEIEKTFRDVDSPDTILSSSSPECCLFEPLCKWPERMLTDSPVQELEQKKSYSPVIPIIAPIPVRLTPYTVNELTSMCYFDKEKDKENIPKSELKPEISLLKSKMSGLGSYSSPLKDTGNVSVTLTLSSAAAEDICGVLSRLAEVLKIPIPATYEIVERTATPPSQKLGLYRKSKNSEINIQSLLNGKPRFCRHCDIVVLSAGIRKKAADLACISKEEQEEEDEVIFCSTNCYMQFALTHRSSGSNLEDKEAATVVAHQGEKVPQLDSSGSVTKQSDEEDLSAEDSTVVMEDVMSTENSSQEGLSKTGIDTSDENTVLDDIHMDVTDSEVLKVGEAAQIKSENINDHSNSNDEPMTLSFLSDRGNKEETGMDIQPRRWKCIKYKYWTPTSPFAPYKPVKEEQVEKAAKPFYHTVKPSQMPKDVRKCIFCHVTGDGDTNGAARLLNMDVDKWVHLNCALWSAEVYETVNGALMNVELAYKRAVMLVCCSCHKQGASLKCFKMRCSNIFHFPCAMKEHCVFFKDKTLLCSHHAHKGNSENELDSVAVYRRVYIDRDEHKQVASMIQGDQYLMRIGSLVFLNIGQLLPQQMQAFHTPNCIYPVGYKVIRFYWSMRKLGRRCQYICSISEADGKPEFHIQVKESDHKDIILKDKSAKGLWQKVLYPIEKMRRQAKTIKIFPDFISGDDLFGLMEPAVLRIVESLPGVDTLQDYNFRYGRSPFLELPLAINPTGCARSEPKLRTHVKRSHTLHTSNSSRCTFHSSFGGIEISSPYVKQFVHSKSSQYRKMKTEWRNNVYLARSRIQGLGLYAARDLEKHTMVIEYIGQLIRNEIAERNEAVYDAQNRGVYMFRLDENRVIDATICGGLARYINHSCNPNCVAEVVQIDRENKILIIANRRINRGEELSYDYKFEVEDDQHKIPCLCKAPNCRKWMN